MSDPGSPRGVEGSVDAEKVVAIGGVNAKNVNFHLGDGARGGATHPITPRLPERQRTFAGREAELAEVHERLCLAAEVGITQQTAVHGHGGIGKTSLAVEYAWRHLADYPGGVFCLACDTAADVPPLHELAPNLGIPAAETTDLTSAAVRVRLERGEPALLILDNVRGAEQWQSRAWREALPGGACRRLITTRAPRLADVPMYALQRLSTEDGVALLALYRPDALASRETVERVVEWFDGLAVGLTVVGIYLSLHPDLGWEPYFGSLERKGLAAVRGTEQEVADVYEQRVDAVFDDLLAALTPAERRAVEFAAVMPEEGIFAPWIVALLSEEEGFDLHEPPGYEGRGADLVVQRLTSMQLLREQADGLLGLHRVLRRRVREVLGERGEFGSVAASVGRLSLLRAERCEGVLTDQTLRTELSALVLLVDELEDSGALVDAARLTMWLVQSLIHNGEYRLGATLLSRFIAPHRLSQLPSAYEPTLRADYGIMLLHMGALEEAKHQLEMTIDLESRLLAPDDPQIAVAYLNLAGVLLDLGDAAAARTWVTRAIGVEEAALEPSHPTLAVSYNLFGVVLRELGELEAAREHMERALQIDYLHYPPDHPELATRLSNLALILQSLGQSDVARGYLERAIEIDEKHRHPTHPVLAVRYGNLATVLNRLGDHSGARDLVHRGMAISARHFDEDHPTMAAYYNNTAHIELASGNPVEACRLFLKALEIGRKTFADSHPNVRKYLEGVSRTCGRDAIPPRVDEAPN